MDRSAITLVRWASVCACLVCRAAFADCSADPFDGVRRSLIAEQMWINGMALSIAELPSLDATAAAQRFEAYWRRENQPLRTKVGDGVEVTSAYRGACLYSLQLPRGADGAAPRYVVSDLRRPPPSLPRNFSWPPAAAGEILGDTVSADGNRLSRLLTYRVDTESSLALQQCVDRLVHGDWKLDGMTEINAMHFVFHGRKGGTGLDVTVMKEGPGSVITMNFAEGDG